MPQTPETGAAEFELLCDVDKPHSVSGPLRLGEATGLVPPTLEVL